MTQAATTLTQHDPVLVDTANALESLGSPTRLAIYRLLVKAGPDGLAVGEIQSTLEIAGSTLSHHIAHLVQNRLIQQAREGRVLRCQPNFERMNQLLTFLTDECCTG
jgi:DNA-binding transcriptional ArsR family regulator